MTEVESWLGLEFLVVVMLGGLKKGKSFSYIRLQEKGPVSLVFTVSNRDTVPIVRRERRSTASRRLTRDTEETRRH